ncbi:MAG TPA: 5,10-methenyltetrahydromethanopterin hydrogenase cofactor biosynthesis protein HmdC [Methanobacteriales archaeon]|nr:MAG: Uncharacterized conserved protein UCP019375 [Methanobacteriaceae archaeon 41_258]MBC7096685.1 5,10-methenyltetrahydromethanopterin hydrogenase cofactor biosynthesis protein HmdC [Methanobacteriales archaeon]MDI3483850.1 hypothetical protein [Methanobacteriaceae archaeon]HIH61632.1 5,10-methenyltetrahydromethanopterin hydrogenase cofactor biosynthesis protein HmdC [Methanobacteriales archaeon]
MEDLIKEAIHNLDAAWELAKIDKDPITVVDAISELSREEAIRLGYNFKRFPIGCDLTEVLVGTCASDLEEIDFLGNCILSDMIGASIHACAYAFADMAESYGIKGVELMRKVREITEVPIDLDHFGEYGPMRFPKEITHCMGQCYMEGPPFKGCPRNRIHSRLLDKEKEALPERDEWVRLSTSVAINLTSAQGAEAHAAPIKEAKSVAKLAREHGKGLEAIMFIGDGYDDLITAFETALEIGVDVFVLEGGPFNLASDPLGAFARAVAMARILAPGKIVATNGAYEDECRVGLRAGLNAIITGFPRNHHGYMCGYSPGTARRGNFGLPRIIKIIKDEVPWGLTRAPIQKGELEALAMAVKAAGEDNVYPTRIGYTFVGDAHWACLPHTPLYRRVKIQKTVNDIKRMAMEGLLGDKVAILGARFLSWVIGKELEDCVDEIIISDTDQWVESVTLDNLRSHLKVDLDGVNGDDKKAYEYADTTIISSTIPTVVNRISRDFRDTISFI